MSLRFCTNTPSMSWILLFAKTEAQKYSVWLPSSKFVQALRILRHFAPTGPYEGEAGRFRRICRSPRRRAADEVELRIRGDERVGQLGPVARGRHRPEHGGQKP